MSNTSKLYSAMKRYTDTMLAARDEYLGTMAKYETAKGSQFYEEQKQAASKKRLEATESIKAETIAQVNESITAMMARANTRKLAPLTADQLAICQAMKLRDKVGTDELIQAGNAMEGNLTGLAILQEVAQKSGVMHNFIADAKGIAGETLTKCIREVRDGCYRVINSDGTTRAARLAAEYHARRYGNGQVNTDTLPSMKAYTDEADFLSSVVSTGVKVADFTEAVN